jgi:hypothetical protein
MNKGSNDSNDDPADDEISMEDKIGHLTKTTFRQLIFSIGFLFFMPALLIACLLGLGRSVETSDALMAIEPVNRVALFDAEIKKVWNKTQNQYAQHLLKMEDQSIFTVNEKFEVLYALSKQSEADYGRMIAAHHKAMYQIASKVRGSAEWYFYYDKKLTALASNQSHRESKMNSYFEEH